MSVKSAFRTNTNFLSIETKMTKMKSYSCQYCDTFLIYLHFLLTSFINIWGLEEQSKCSIKQ